MKPWPKAIADRYPAARNAVPDRPWWRQDIKAESGYRYVRTDGLSVRDAVAADAQARLAICDEAKPLPRPSYRVGQVWADQHGFAVMLVTVFGDRAWWLSPQFVEATPFELYLYPYLVHDPHFPDAAPWAPTEIR